MWMCEFDWLLLSIENRKWNADPRHNDMVIWIYIDFSVKPYSFGILCGIFPVKLEIWKVSYCENAPRAAVGERESFLPHRRED